MLDRLSPQEFGRSMQQLLACTFQLAGFVVSENAVGVPDIVARLPDGGVGPVGAVAIEVKTSESGEIQLSKRELDAIRMNGELPVVAALSFPDVSPSWALVHANDVSPRKWDVRRLLAKPQVDVGFDVTDRFHDVVGDVDVASLAVGKELDSWLANQRERCLRMRRSR